MRRMLLCLALVLAIAACDSEDGRVLPPPTGPVTTPSSTPVIDTADGSGVVEIFSLSSDSFVEGGVIPIRHTCDGAGVSPPLAWASTPPAAELALVVRDLDADGFVHWVVTGIDATVSGFGEGGLPEVALPGPNDSGGRGWTGPCPPAGPAHRYRFTLYAVPEPLVMPLDLTAQEAATLVEGSATDRADLTGVYGR